LPLLTRLYLPLVSDSSQQLMDDDPRIKTYIVEKFVERHREKLTFFRVLNLARDYLEMISLVRTLKPWLSVQEIRLDSTNVQDHGNEIPEGLEWTRTSMYLSGDGCGLWG